MSSSPQSYNLCHFHAFEVIAEYQLNDELEGFIFITTSHDVLILENVDGFLKLWRMNPYSSILIVS